MIGLIKYIELIKDIDNQISDWEKVNKTTPEKYYEIYNIIQDLKDKKKRYIELEHYNVFGNKQNA